MLCTLRAAVSVLASAVVVAVAPAAWAQPPKNPGPLPAEALALPPNVDMLIGIDARGVFSSAEYKMLTGGQPLPGMPTPVPQEARDAIARGLGQVRAEVGIDLERDLDRVVIGLADIAGKDQKFVLLAVGRFDTARIADSFAREYAAHRVDRKTLAGRTMLVVTKNGKPDSALAFPTDNLLLFGTPATVESVAGDVGQGRRPLETNAALLGLVGSLEPASSVFVAVGPAATSAMRQATGPQPPPFPVPDTMTLAGRFGGGFELAAEMPTDADARNMADVVRGGLAALRMQMAQRAPASGAEEMNRLMEAVQVSAEGRRARLSVAGPNGGIMATGVIAALAIPSLLRARVAANEAAAIGDIRAVISAEVAYEASAQGYADLACLSKPASCLRSYSGPAFIDAAVAGAAEKAGYKRAFHAGPAGKTRGTYRAFAYTATPSEPGKTGVRSFCGDATGRVCFDPKGAPIVPVAGACPQSCTELK